MVLRRSRAGVRSCPQRVGVGRSTGQFVRAVAIILLLATVGQVIIITTSRSVLGVASGGIVAPRRRVRIGREVHQVHRCV